MCPVARPPHRAGQQRAIANVEVMPSCTRRQLCLDASFVVIVGLLAYVFRANVSIRDSLGKFRVSSHQESFNLLYALWSASFEQHWDPVGFSARDSESLPLRIVQTFELAVLSCTCANCDAEFAGQQ